MTARRAHALARALGAMAIAVTVGACAMRPSEGDDTGNVASSKARLSTSDPAVTASPGIEVPQSSRVPAQAACSNCPVNAFCCGTGTECCGGLSLDDFCCGNTCCHVRFGSCCGDKCCPAGSTCIDGVCCDAPCNGPCEACSFAKNGQADGKCLPVIAGTDPDNECTDQGLATCGLDGMCDGNRACRLYAGGTVCRPSQGPCDPQEACPTNDMGNAGCPTDVKSPAGTACTADSNPCTLDQCDGSSAACQHPAGNAGAQCRASQGMCDPAESCTGTSATCPGDGKSTAECRAAAGPCDLAESCDGMNNNCPANEFRPNTYQCRPPSCSGGVATLAQNCPGNAAQCPPSQTQNCSPSTCSGTQCGGCMSDAQCASTQYCSAGICVSKLAQGQACSGGNQCTSGHCVDTVCCNSACNAGTCDSCNLPTLAGTCSPVPAATVCRPAAGPCDAAETCGGSTQCPSDAKRPSGASCSDDSNPCTLDQCDGTSNACQHPAGNAGTQCRAANGSACDVADSCDGTSTTCPDGKRPTAYVCRLASGECDVEEKCDGSHDACPIDAWLPDDTSCSDDGLVCTTDKCKTGSCQHQAGNAGTICRSSNGPCDVADTCSGSSSACPDAKQPNGTVCRAAAGECDLDERCDGTGDACPATDAKKPNGTPCTDEGNACTADTCDGTTNACRHSPGNAGAVCRPANGPCDAADTCSGTATTCPDAKRPRMTPCRPAADVCDVEEGCDGTSDACPNDSFKASTVSCRMPSCTGGTATLAANCTGSSAACPAPETQPCPGSVCAGTICSGNCTTDAQCNAGQYCSAGVCTPKLGLGRNCSTDGACASAHCADGVCCDTACNDGICDSCSIVLGTCSPANPMMVCRPAVGECDVAETCGGATTCPADVNKDGQSCSSDGNTCTRDVCAGNACTHPPAPGDTICRPAEGECDAPETCGGATACPVDKGKLDGAGCTNDGNPCTRDVCMGAVCVHPPGNSGMVCRAATGGCDMPEMCDGQSEACPPDGFRSDGTPCVGDGNVCTVDACRSGSCTHLPGNPAIVCRASLGECDVEEACDGVSPTCPTDGFRDDGMPCAPDSNACTRDVCQSGTCAHPAGNAGAICRQAATLCDVLEKCDGLSPNCPSDGYKPQGTACLDDGKPCTSDQCQSGKCTHSPTDGSHCSDGNICTDPDTCSAGLCSGTPVVGCVCRSNADCDDLNVCNGVETCVAGACRAGMPLDCDDHNDCTEDGCEPARGCQNPSLADGAPCSDDAYCTVDDECRSGRCAPGKPRDCSGAATGSCQTGFCEEANKRCASKPAPDDQKCNDGDECTVLDKCRTGACVGTGRPGCRICSVASGCDDNQACTVDLCDDITKTCMYVGTLGCGDAGADGGTEAGGADGSTADARSDALDGADAPGASAHDDGTYEREPFGACTCRTPRAPSSGGGWGLTLAAILFSVHRCRARRYALNDRNRRAEGCHPFRRAWSRVAPGRQGRAHRRSSRPST